MSVNESPLAALRRWLDEAIEREGMDARVMVLATASPELGPSARCVVLREIVDDRLRFASSLAGRKGADLAADPRAAAVLWWPSLRRQVVVEGRTAPVRPADADAIFADRPRDAQLAAAAFTQGAEIDGREELDAGFAAAEQRYSGRPVERPPAWTAVDLTPDAIEFWSEGDARRHERRRYTREPGGGWRAAWLAP